MNRFSKLHLARCVLELVTPLSVGTGHADGVFDTALVRDANGLPAVPATSLAGVLRGLFEEEHGGERTRTLFGYQDRTGGQASRVRVSWGAILDSRGRPVWGLLLGEDVARLDRDPVLSRACRQKDTPVYRNRVRLTHRGAAADGGKFDRTVLPAGNRFAVEISLVAGGDDDGRDWRDLLALLGHPGLRLGGGTRSGLGRVCCVKAARTTFDLARREEAARLRSLGTDPWLASGLEPWSPENARGGGSHWGHATLELEFKDFLRIGQGSRSLASGDSGDKAPDLLPVFEERLVWNGMDCVDAGDEDYLLPASSLKGVLAHRMAFHARRFRGEWNPDGKDPAPEDVTPPEVRALMGEIKDSRRGTPSEAGGLAGALCIDDAWQSVDVGTAPATQRLMHNAIDRFTGGVRDHMLFEEEVLYRSCFRLEIALDRRRLDRNCRILGVDPQSVQRAFDAALSDLCEGRLPLGGRTTTGLGFCRGRLSGGLWPDAPSTEASASRTTAAPSVAM